VGYVAEEVYTAEVIVPRDLCTRTDARIYVVHDFDDQAGVAVKALDIPVPPSSSQKLKPNPKSTRQHPVGHKRHPHAISSSYNNYYGRKAVNRVRPERPNSFFQGVERACFP
jgi:hypothetical protein